MTFPKAFQGSHAVRDAMSGWEEFLKEGVSERDFAGFCYLGDVGIFTARGHADTNSALYYRR